MITTFKTGYWRGALACLILVLLAACSTGKRSGGYYKDDGPEANPPANLDQVPDAVPKIEPLASGPNKPYTVLGRSYTPDTSGKPYRVQGRASWYGKKFHGNSTSNGERYDMYAMTAAHPTLPIPSYVRVTRLENNKSVVLRINDRGPFHSDRIIDLSYVAAYKLGMLGPGSTEVLVERIMPDQIRNWQPGPASSNVAAIAIPPSAPLVATAVPIGAAANVELKSDGSPTTSNEDVQKAAPANVTAVAPNAMFLQLGAFSDQAKAQSLAARVTEQLPAQINAPVLIDRSATNLYRVRIGPFASRDAAVQAVSPVSQATGVTPSLSLP
jgi:rare lipoprotein A